MSPRVLLMALATVGVAHVLPRAAPNGLATAGVQAPAQAGRILLVHDATSAYYAQLGTVLDGSQPQFPRADTIDPTIYPAAEPDLTRAASRLDRWMSPEPLPPGSSWTGPQTIPTTWPIYTETAVLYVIDAGPAGIHDVRASVGVDNGVFIWANGRYKFGALAAGPCTASEYADVPLGDLPPGPNYIQVLLEDHGALNCFTIRITGVPQPTPIPTPTATSTDTPTAVPTHTATSTPTATATPTNEPTATSSPTPTPAPVCLPLDLNERCAEKWSQTDLVLVLDMSTSMNQLTGAGRPKLDAVLDAAKLLGSCLHLTPDETGQHSQIAIVGFNAQAWVEQPLTNDPVIVATAINRLRGKQVDGTRLDLALLAGRQVFEDGRRRPENAAVMILLTDGLPNRVPIAEDGRVETTVRRAASAARAAGVTIYAIGVGLTDRQPPEVNQDLLLAVVSAPDHYHYAPSVDALRAVCWTLCAQIPCDLARFWPRAAVPGRQ